MASQQIRNSIPFHHVPTTITPEHGIAFFACMQPAMLQAAVLTRANADSSALPADEKKAPKPKKAPVAPAAAAPPAKKKRGPERKGK
jgi:hypothetical protein